MPFAPFGLRSLATRVIAHAVVAAVLAGCALQSTSPPQAIGTATLSDRSMMATGAGSPRVKSVVVVIMENRDYDLVIGSADAPYVNGTLVPEAALLTDSHAVGHPSQPNYLALFSGSTQGITDDSCPHTFSAPNLGAELVSKRGASFAGYSESMPSNGYEGCTSGTYARKHNPWVENALALIRNGGRASLRSALPPP